MDLIRLREWGRPEEVQSPERPLPAALVIYALSRPARIQRGADGVVAMNAEKQKKASQYPRRPLPAASFRRSRPDAVQRGAGPLVANKWGRRGGDQRRPRAGRDSWVSNATDVIQRSGAR